MLIQLPSIRNVDNNIHIVRIQLEYDEYMSVYLQNVLSFEDIPLDFTFTKMFAPKTYKWFGWKT